MWEAQGRGGEGSRLDSLRLASSQGIVYFGYQFPQSLYKSRLRSRAPRLSEKPCPPNLVRIYRIETTRQRQREHRRALSRPQS